MVLRLTIHFRSLRTSLINEVNMFTNNGLRAREIRVFVIKNKRGNFDRILTGVLLGSFTFSALSTRYLCYICLILNNLLRIYIVVFTVKVNIRSRLWF